MEIEGIISAIASLLITGILFFVFLPKIAETLDFSAGYIFIIGGLLIGVIVIAFLGRYL